jgi:putative membrane protein
LVIENRKPLRYTKINQDRTAIRTGGTVRKLTGGLLIIYLLLTSLAVIRVIFGLQINLWLTPLNTLVGFLFSVSHSSQRHGWKATLVLLASVFIISLGMECIGVVTGLIYGPYHYTDQLGVKFLGLVPFLIPIAWFMMIYPSSVIAERLLMPGGRGGIIQRFGVAALAGVIMTAWDLSMDPMMVFAGHWVWEVDGAFFGVPIQNFAGWWVTTFFCLLIFELIRMRIKKPVNGVPEQWAVISYTIQAAATVVTSALIGLAGSGMAGFFAMLPWILLGWLGLSKKGGQDA